MLDTKATPKDCIDNAMGTTVKMSIRLVPCHRYGNGGDDDTSMRRWSHLRNRGG